MSLGSSAGSVLETESICGCLHVCVGMSDGKQVLNPLSLVPQATVAGQVTYSAVASSSQKGDQKQEALVVIVGFCSAAAISICQRGSQWELALDLPTSMADASVISNTITYSAAFSACEQECISLNMSSLILREEVASDEITYSATIDVCEQEGEWEHLKLMFGAKLNLMFRAVTCNAALGAFDVFSLKGIQLWGEGRGAGSCGCWHG